jgi:hypothetical protein
LSGQIFYLFGGCDVENVAKLEGRMLDGLFWRNNFVMENSPDIKER